MRLDGLDFYDLFELSGDIVILTNRDGIIVAANRAARELGGYGEADVARGVDLRHLMTPDEYEAGLVLRQRALDGLPFPETYERDIRRHDGSRRRLELRSSVVRLANGERLLQTVGRDVTEARRATHFQTALVRVSQALWGTQEQAEIGRIVCSEARSALDLDGVYLWMRDGDHVVALAGDGVRSDLAVGMRLSLHDPAVAAVCSDTATVVCNHLDESNDSLLMARQYGVKALLSVPLRHAADTAGYLIFIDGRRPDGFDPLRYDRALIFAAQAAVAIENAQSRQREADEAAMSAALLQVNRAIRESIEESELVDHLARSVRQVVGCDNALVTNWLPEHGSFRVAGTAGYPSAMVEEILLIEFRPGDFPVATALLNREIIERVDVDPAVSPIYARYGARTQFAVPMVHGGKLIGGLHLFYAERRTPMTPAERRLLEGIAAQAAVAVDHARVLSDLRRAYQLKSDFLGTMSHELRTPLAAILGYGDLMRDSVLGTLTPEQRDALDRIVINGRSLLDLVNVMLDVNRLESGRVVVEKTNFAVAHLLAEVQAERFMPVPRVALQWPKVDDQLVIFSDRAKLKIILRSLIGNGLKFTRNGHVRLMVQALDDRVAFIVSDTGIGIAPERQASIFAMFSEADPQRDGVRSGSGLGLYLVKRYVDLLGATLKLDSAVGRGSTFTLEIPNPD